jgi:cytochrome c-type biogenesis protein CcsB
MHDSAIKPLMPALKSNWLAFHVMSCMLAYGGFTLSFVAALCYLVAVRPGSTTEAGTLKKFESILDKTVSFGFLFLTLGILSGSVWANRAWGSYWSWDPKETWSLVTWFVYAIFLHCRFIIGWRGVAGSVIAVIGFICVIITYVGVNYLMQGLHSYGRVL